MPTSFSFFLGKGLREERQTTSLETNHRHHAFSKASENIVKFKKGAKKTKEHQNILSILTVSFFFTFSRRKPFQKKAEPSLLEGSRVLRKRERERERERRSLVAAVFFLLVLWSPPLLCKNPSN